MRVGLASVVLATMAPVVLALGCEPPPPTFLVNTFAVGADAVVGDGVCEVTGGAGDCSLEAALDEANARGEQTDIRAPAGDYSGTSVHVTGDIRLNWGGELEHIRVRGIVVEPSGRLLVDGVVVNLAVGGVGVLGVLGARHASIYAPTNPVVVGATGIASFESSTIESVNEHSIINGGLLSLFHSTIAGIGPRARPLLLTEPAGTTSVRSSAFVAAPGVFGGTGTPGPACGGVTPISAGYNAAWDATCGLTDEGDVPGANPAVERRIVPGGLDLAVYEPRPPTPGAGNLIDVIPPGTSSCGSSVTRDVLGAPRPADGDGDGDARCDIGAVERPAA